MLPNKVYVFSCHTSGTLIIILYWIWCNIKKCHEGITVDIEWSFILSSITLVVTLTMIACKQHPCPSQNPYLWLCITYRCGADSAVIREAEAERLTSSPAWVIARPHLKKMGEREVWEQRRGICFMWDPSVVSQGSAPLTDCLKGGS